MYEEKEKNKDINEDTGETYWSKRQLEAVLTGLFSLGYGRTEMLAKRSSGLEKRKYEFVQEAVDYACSLGMALCRSQEAEARGSKLVVRGGDIVDENEDDGDPDRERR